MATDIKTAGSIVVNTPDTPVDKNARVNTLSDVDNMTNPCLGGIFYCIQTGKHYKITALKNKTINGVTFANAAVGTYEELNSGSSGDFCGLSVWTGTQGEYNKLPSVDDNTLYLIEDS